MNMMWHEANQFKRVMAHLSDFQLLPLTPVSRPFTFFQIVECVGSVFPAAPEELKNQAQALLRRVSL